MSSNITGKQYPLSKIFCSDFSFEIPNYQRPYAWTEEETKTLIDDLYSFWQDKKNSTYFLGSIVLIKEDDKPDAEVIDGQQRLTTLTILYAVLASRISNSGRKMNIFEKIVEKGSELDNLEPKPRLKLRDRDNKFFEKYIQNIDIENLIALDPKDQDTEAKGHIINNAKSLLEKIDTYFKSEEEIFEFCKFLSSDCYLIGVSTPAKELAFRIFSIMNNRGLSLMPTDIIKSDVIGEINETERDKYTKTWEDIENNLGRDSFNDLFSHIRMIYVKAKAQESMWKEFNKNILDKVDAVTFIDEILVPYSEAYSDIKKCTYSSKSNAEAVNEILTWLNMIDNSDWVPVAMKFYEKYHSNAEYMLIFLKKLERLATCMRLLSMSINQRIERYGKILTELEKNNTNDNIYGSEIELTDDEKKGFIEVLNSDIYTLTGIKKNYVVKRLDSFISDKGVKYYYNSSVFTIEHVLPQNVKEGSQWEKDWSDVDERKFWLHKIGNLIPLSRKKNSSAQDYDFDTKKEKYFKNKDGISSYALTTSVISEDNWTPETVKRRQENCMIHFIKGWDLN